MLLAPGLAAADLRVVSVTPETSQGPHLTALLEVTPNSRPAADYILDLGIKDLPPIPGVRLRKGDPRKTSVAIVVDGSTTFLGAAGDGSDVRLAAKPEAQSALEQLGNIGGHATFSLIVATDSVGVLASNVDSLVGRTLPDPDSDAFELDAGLTEATRLLAASYSERKIIVVIGVPRSAPASDVQQRLRTDGIETYTIEADTRPGQRSAAFASLANVPRRYEAKVPNELALDAERVVEDINSVVMVEFPIPEKFFDGRSIDVSLQLGSSAGHYDGPPVVLRRIEPPKHPGGFPWLLIGGIASVGVVGLGAWLLRRRTPSLPVVPRPIEHTIPLPEPQVVNPQPEDQATYAPPPPSFAAWFFVSDGPAKGQTLPLRRSGATLIGSANAQIKLEGSGVRTAHAKIVARAGRVSIVGVPDGQKVRVAGKDVDAAQLQDGTIVEIGAHKLLFKATP